ncbi:MAG: hypothetical protein ABSF43_16615 [Rectinemataceae bacterium]
MIGFFGRGRASTLDGLESGADAFLRRVRALAARPRGGDAALPGRSELAVLVQAARAALESEEASLRPRDSEGRPGGIVELPDLPTILVPDLHARPAFIASVLSWRPPGYGESIASLLEGRRACLVCLGDVFHSEVGSARRRWAAAYREYGSFWVSHASMDEEMGLSLAAASIVLATKVAFPANFHYLKGNHDNIADEEGRGDHSFYKFAVEGEMVASWFLSTYGEALLEAYREFELDLPILALGSHFAASHGEPAFALSRSDLIEYRSRPDVVEALIWTANGDAEAFSVARSLDALLGPERAEKALWFAGHRPVDGRYALRAGGRFVQFHDPGAARVAFLEPGRSPDPDRDILDVPII